VLGAVLPFALVFWVVVAAMMAVSQASRGLRSGSETSLIGDLFITARKDESGVGKVERCDGRGRKARAE